MRWLFILSLLPVAMVLSRPAHACSCAQPGTPSEALADAAAVFRGTVTDIDEPGGGCGGTSSADPVEVTFEVTTVWKGDVGRTTEVTTARSSASCGIDFTKGGEYVVYAHETDGDLNAGLCSRTRLVSDATDDLADLGPGTTAALEPRRTSRVRFAHVGVLGLLALFLGLARRR